MQMTDNWGASSQQRAAEPLRHSHYLRHLSPPLIAATYRRHTSWEKPVNVFVPYTISSKGLGGDIVHQL